MDKDELKEIIEQLKTDYNKAESALYEIWRTIDYLETELNNLKNKDK